MVDRKTSTVRRSTRKTPARTSKALSRTAHKISRTTKLVTKKTTGAASNLPRRTKNSVRKKVLQRKPMTWREISLLGIIIVSATAIVSSLLISANFHPQLDAERELKKLANDYYIEYLYPRILGIHRNTPEVVLADYIDTGLPSVRLRQMLMYNDHAHADSLKYFSNAHYQCDTNYTYVRYFPVAPYGPRDYTAEYTYSCVSPDSTD